MDQGLLTIVVALFAPIATIVAAWLEHRKPRTPAGANSERSLRVARTVTVTVALCVVGLVASLWWTIPELLSQPAARYRLTAGGPLGPDEVRLSFNERDIDTHDAVRTHPEWHFIAPRDGIYRIEAQVGVEGQGSPASRAVLALWKEGATPAFAKLGVSACYADSGVVTACYPRGATIISLRKSETVYVSLTTGNLTNARLRTDDSSYGYITVEWIGQR